MNYLDYQKNCYSQHDLFLEIFSPCNAIHIVEIYLNWGSRSYFRGAKVSESGWSYSIAVILK